MNDEQFIENPTLAELTAVLPSSFDILRNHEQPFGEWLPNQLDALLKQYGYDWTIDFPSRGRRRIRVFKRNSGTPRPLRLQPPGSEVNVNLSNLESKSLTTNLAGQSFNSITVVGDYEQYESTFYLERGWPKEYDASDTYILGRNDPSWMTDKNLRNVWRKWVLNEAGDYKGDRAGFFQPYNFDHIFGKRKYVFHRRKFEPCLTIDKHGVPIGHAGGYFIEWWDNDLADWRPWDDLETGKFVSILEHECGLYFSGDTIPQEIYDQGDYAQVRITASVQSDTRALVAVDDWPTSRLSDYRPYYLNVGSRFKFMKRNSSSRFVGTIYEASEVDDAKKMKSLARELLDRWNVATISGSATLTGINHDYAKLIGDTVSGIDGTGTDFNVSPTTTRYPTIVGAKIDFNNQSLDLVLDTYRGERRL